jgi:hypothetical protein
MHRIPEAQWLGPDDLAMCQAVLEQACSEVGVDLTSLDAGILASVVLALFNSGVRDRNDLLERVRARYENFRSLDIPL